MASFPEPVEYKIVRNVQSVRTFVTELDQSNTPIVSEVNWAYCLRYSVMAGTPDKMLEHLLETKIGKTDGHLGNIHNSDMQKLS